MLDQLLSNKKAFSAVICMLFFAIVMIIFVVTNKYLMSASTGTPTNLLLHTDLHRESKIVETALSKIPKENQDQAEMWALETKKLALKDLERFGKLYWSPLSKGWCTAVMLHPSPYYIYQCSRARFGSLVDSWLHDPVDRQRLPDAAEDTLILIRAALKILEARNRSDTELYRTLTDDLDCLTAFAHRIPSDVPCAEPFIDVRALENQSKGGSSVSD